MILVITSKTSQLFILYHLGPKIMKEMSKISDLFKKLTTVNEESFDIESDAISSKLS